jgi:hypothetical protein
MFKVWQKYYYGTRGNIVFVGNQGVREVGLFYDFNWNSGMVE